jgi:hypothetical protein
MVVTLYCLETGFVSEIYVRINTLHKNTSLPIIIIIIIIITAEAIVSEKLTFQCTTVNSTVTSITL